MTFGEQLKELLTISHYAGMREDLVQAGGGNSSVKLDDRTMLIKASGYQLAELTETSGYSTIDYSAVRDALPEGESPAPLTEEDGKNILASALLGGGKPSIETFLHAVTDVVTLHTHPIAVNILAVRKNGMDILKRLFPEALVVGYETPGIKLAQEYFMQVRQNRGKENQIIFLKNHGLIVAGKTAKEVIEKNETILKIIETYLGLDMSEQHGGTTLWNAFSAAGQEGIVWLVTDINVLRAYREFQGPWSYGFCPDCLVYCGRRMLHIADHEDPMEALCRVTAEHGPVVVVEWRKALYIFAQNVGKAMEVQSVLSFSAQVMLHNRGQSCDLLSEEEQNYLLHWEAEKYRRSIQR